MTFDRAQNSHLPLPANKFWPRLLSGCVDPGLGRRRICRQLKVGKVLSMSSNPQSLM